MATEPFGRPPVVRSIVVSEAPATVTDMTATDPAVDEQMQPSYDVARRSNMFRIYREASILQGLLNAAIVYDHAIEPEVDAALSVLKRLLPYAQERSVGDLHRAGTPETQELLDAVTGSVAQWDAAMWRDPDDEDE